MTVPGGARRRPDGRRGRDRLDHRRQRRRQILVPQGAGAPGGPRDGHASVRRRRPRRLLDARDRRPGVALVPEGRKLFPSLTVQENLRIGWELGRQGDIGFDQIYRVVPGARRAARPARARTLRRTAADGRARPGAARQSAPSALRRDQPRSRAAHRQRTLRDHPDGARPRRRRSSWSSRTSRARSRRRPLLLSSSRARCRSPGQPADADRELIMQHYFGA